MFCLSPRYYMNACTPGYSFAWWQWPDWEKHIDWMALNGVNLPLAPTGQEAVWRRVWRRLGLTDLDLEEHFAGPAFLPWGRMGNLRKWGGPLSRHWHKLQLQLQHRILDRMRSLGMVPVLPAFAGHVPDAVVARYPNSSFSRQMWHNFRSNYSGVYLLEPTDPLFQEIGSLFIKEQVVPTFQFSDSNVPKYNPVSSLPIVQMSNSNVPKCNPFIFQLSK